MAQYLKKKNAFVALSFFFFYISVLKIAFVALSFVLFRFYFFFFGSNIRFWVLGFGFASLSLSQVSE